MSRSKDMEMNVPLAFLSGIFVACCYCCILIYCQMQLSSYADKDVGFRFRFSPNSGSGRTGPKLSQSWTWPDFENTLARPDRDRSGLLKLSDPTRPSKIPLIPKTNWNLTELPGFGLRFLYVIWGTLETLVIMIVSYYILHWNISKVLVQTFAMYH